MHDLLFFLAGFAGGGFVCAVSAKTLGIFNKATASIKTEVKSKL